MRAVLVTGACINTGVAIVEKFAKEGQNVVFTGRNIEKVRLAERNYREKFPDVEIKGFAIDSLIDERTIDEKAVKDLFSELDEKGIFNLMMLCSLLIPVVLFVYYSYTNDLQAQGRYIMPAVYPIMFFAVSGFGKLFEKFFKCKDVEKWFYRITGTLWMIGSIAVYLTVIIPAYC